jgi:hypothetical protein
MSNNASVAAAVNEAGSNAGGGIPVEFTIIIVIIVLAGLVGGYAGYLNEGDPPPPPPGDAGQQAAAPARSPWLLLLLGIVAAACVPLFLSLVKSSLINDILTKSGAQRLEPILVFAGLCLVAAFSARRFIASVSDKILQRISNVEVKAEDAKKTAQLVAAEVDLEAADDAREPRPAEAGPQGEDVALLPSEAEPVTPEERRVLQAMTKRTYRTRTGIAEDSGISKMRISELLEYLADRKLALPVKSPRTGGSRWIITQRGLAALAKPA